MRKTKHLAKQVLAIFLLALFITGCKKADNYKPEPKLSDEEILNKVKELNQKQLEEGKVRMTFTPRSIESGMRVRRSKGGEVIENMELNAPCSIEVIDLVVTSIAVDYAGATCTGGGYTYVAKVYFSIRKKTSTATFNPASVVFDMSLSGPNSYFAYSSLSPTYLGASGTDLNYVATITFTDPSSGFEFDLSTHLTISGTVLTDCSGTGYWIEPYQIYNLTTTEQCKTLSPIFVNPNVYGTKTFSVSGWLLPCGTMPAHFVTPEDFEFQYRKVGDTTWITPGWSPGDYSFTVHRIDVAEVATYQYRWRNKKSSATSCVGPYWEDFYPNGPPQTYPTINISY